MEIKNIVSDLKPQIITEIQKLVGIPSVKYDGKSIEDYNKEIGEEQNAPYGKNIKSALEYALELCHSLGFKTKNIGGYVGYAEVGEGQEMVGILGHLDVVPAGENWSYPPFKGTIVDDKLYGRGVLDDKGPMVACIYAVKALMSLEYKFNKRIRLIFGTDEECDWEDMPHYVESEELPTMGFTPDADFPATYGEKGILQFDIIVELGDQATDFTISGGECYNSVPDECQATIQLIDGTHLDMLKKGKAAHGSTPEMGENAIALLMEEINNLKSEGKIENDSPLARFVEFYMDKVGLDYYGETAGCKLHDEESGDLTFNVGMIHVEGNKVIISIDIRYPVTFDYAKILENLTEHLKIPLLNVTIANPIELPPIYSDKEGALITNLMSVYKEITGDEREPMTMGGATYARTMENIVAFGPLFPGREDTVHQKDEYIFLEDLRSITEIYAKAIKKLACD